MIFNSIEYLLFFAAVVLVHFALPSKHRWLLLLVASYAFYMSWNPAYILLIVASTFIDYFVGAQMARSSQMNVRRLLLLVSLTANLGLLFSFKYWDFFWQGIGALGRSLGQDWTVPATGLLLPVGISFYTFQTLSYTIDIYRGTLRPEPHFGRFALFVAFFPQLVAGPIERARQLIPQFRVTTTIDRAEDWERVTSGLQLILWGLFKKVVIADRLSLYVDAVYGNAAAHNATSYLIATYAFAFQIYCDFSGYTDIAIGSAKVLGYDLMKNFERPYFATSITDFWRRWHISLSTWLRDYLYISMGGNRKGATRTYWNLLVTMVLGGLWHGASWNFVIWGTIHGLLLALSRATLPARDRIYQRLSLPIWLRDGLRILITFHLVCFCWIFFRADDLETARLIVGGLFSDNWGLPFENSQVFFHASIGLGTLLIVQLLQERCGSARELLRAQPVALRWLCWYGLLLGIALLGVDGGSQFIYFQF